MLINRERPYNSRGGKAMSFAWRMSVSALWVLVALPVMAQEPRAKPPRLSAPLSSRQVIVDSGGSGDFTTLSAALEFVTMQPRTDLSRWLVQIYPGMPAAGGLSQYEETSVS